MVRTAVIIAAGMGSRLNGEGGNLPKPLVPVGGVGLLKRAILSAKRAGIGRFVVVLGYRGGEIQAAIDSDSQIDVPVTWVYNPEYERANGVSVLKAREAVDGPFVLMMSDHLFEPDILSRLRQVPVSPDETVLCVDRNLDGIFDMPDATKVQILGDRIVQIDKELDRFDAVDTGIFLCGTGLFDALERSISNGDGSLSGGIRILAVEGNMRTVDIDGAFWMDVDTPEALAQANRRLYSMLAKPTDGFVSRHLNRKISTRITRLLANTPVRPNHISVATMLLSFLAAWWVASGSYLYLALGGLVFQCASILDGSDGELAKLKFMGSRAGEWFDTVADNVSYIAFFLGVTYGMYRLTGASNVLTIGLVGTGLVILSLSIMALYLQQIGSGSMAVFNAAFSNEVPEERRSWFHRFCCSIKFAGRRDFFAALFATLAILNCLEAIYWLSVTGIGLTAAGIFGYAGYMLSARGAFPGALPAQVEPEKLVSQKAD